jgi:hypothetical protein
MKNNASGKKPSEDKEKSDESALVEAKIDGAVVDEVAAHTEGAAEAVASTSSNEEKPNVDAKSGVDDRNKKKKERGSGKNTTSAEVRN